MSDKDDEEAKKIIEAGPIFEDRPHTTILFPEHSTKDHSDKESRNEHTKVTNLSILIELVACESKTDIINIINKYHSFVTDGSKGVIFREINNRIQTLEISAFKAWCANKSVPVTSINAEGNKLTEQVKLFDLWFNSRLRFEYTTVDFDPSKTFDRNDRRNDVYNMWRGWETVAKPGSYKEALQFIYEIICDRNKKHFFWVLSWIADLVQNPADPKGVALVLIGSKGIGKTFFGEMICALLGEQYTFITANKNDIFGDFNGHLSNLMFLVGEEAIWAENRHNEAILKVLISGKKRPSRSLYHDTQKINNYLRPLLLANPGWAVPASEDERRFSILNPSDKKREDHAYFGKLKQWQDSGGLGALMDFLQRYRIGRGGVDIRSALVTKGLRDQQEESLEPFEQWLLEDMLWTGVVRCCWLGDGGASAVQINRSSMHEQYVDWCKKMDIRGKKLTPKKFGIKFGSYFPTFDDDGNVKMAKNGRAISIFTYEEITKYAHRYSFPSIAESRKIVFKKMRRKDLSYWDGAATKWSAAENSAIFKDGAKPTEAPRVDEKDKDIMQQFIEGEIVLPMGGPRRDN
jgi:hypothetical protein